MNYFTDPAQGKKVRFNISQWLGFVALILLLINFYPSRGQQMVMAMNKKRPSINSPQLSEKLTLRMENVSLRAMLAEIKKETGYIFIYSDDAILAIENVSIDVKNESIKKVLEDLCTPLSIKFYIYGTQIVLSADTKTKAYEPAGESPKDVDSTLSIYNFESHLQDSHQQSFASLTVTGKVTNEIAEGLPGVSVIIKNTTTGTITNVDGDYTLAVSRGDETLVFSFMGYSKQEVAIDHRPVINISLIPDVTSLAEVVVIGSRANTARTNVEKPVPVDVFSAAEMQKTGQIEVGQMMQYISPSFNSSKNGINGVANYADPATLRGLSPDQVLVLVNGKRRHQFSALNLNVTIGKGTVVTDLNTIPSLALERLEVLRDGAAAQYGSDAIAGIVNLALRKNVNQGSFKTQYGITKEGDGATYLAGFNYGFKLGKENSYLNLTLQYQHANETDRSDPFNGTIYSSVKTRDDSIRLARGVWPAGDFRVSKYGSNQSKSGQVFFNAGYPLNERWSVYSFGGYSQKNILAFGFFRNAIPANANSNISIHPDGYSPELPGETIDYSGVIGLNRKISQGWNLDFSSGYGFNSLDLWANKTANPSMGADSPTDFYVGKSSFAQSTSEINLSKNLGSLWGTQFFNIAFGGQFRIDYFKLGAGDQYSYFVGPLAASNGKSPGSSGRPGIALEDETDVKRTNIGIYADIETDITSQLLLATAVRYENYSDFGNNVSGKLATRLKITPAFSLRGSVNKGFRAPSLQQIYNSVTTSTVQAGQIRQTKQLPSNESNLKQIGIRSPKAENSWNYNLGLTAAAGDQLLFTLDAYQIDIQDRIIISEALAVNSIEALKPLFPGIQEVSFFTNHIDTRTRGIEFVTSYKQHATGEGFNASLAFTVNETIIKEIMPTPGQLQAETVKAIAIIDTVSISLIETSQPRQKVLLSLGYQLKKFNFSVRSSYFGKVIAWEKPAGGNHRSQTFGSKMLLDASVVYTLTPKITFTLGANNVTDVYPDKVDATYASYFNGQTPYTRNASQFGFNGAYYYLNFTLNF